MLTEFLEELEVRCRFGVKCTVTCQSFGVMESEFAEVADGCPVVTSLKSILVENYEDRHKGYLLHWF